MSARADLCGGRSEMIVPTATSSRCALIEIPDFEFLANDAQTGTNPQFAITRASQSSKALCAHGDRSVLGNTLSSQPTSMSPCKNQRSHKAFLALQVFSTEKFSKRGMFLPAEKRGVSSPRFTTNPPQSHHQETTFCTTLFSKNPAKTPLHHANIFSPVTIRKSAPDFP